MRIVVKRTFKGKNYTIGKLYINGDYFCDTLEDVVRDGEKVYGKTAIPEGTYTIVLTMSNRFKKILPLLLQVPKFEGVRIHSGNTAADTEGCILVGKNTEKGKVLESRAVFAQLMKRLESVENKETITIELVWYDKHKATS